MKKKYFQNHSFGQINQVPSVGGDYYFRLSYRYPLQKPQSRISSIYFSELMYFVHKEKAQHSNFIK